MIRDLWQHNRLALMAFIVALGALGVFGARTIASTIYWYDPAHQNQPLAPWMTPRYVARSYDLPRDVMEEVFFIERGNAPPRMKLDDIANRNGLTLHDLQVRLDAANAAFEAEREAKHDE